MEVLLELEVDEVHLPREAQHAVQPPLRLARQHHVPRLGPPRREVRHGVHRVADVAQRGEDGVGDGIQEQQQQQRRPPLTAAAGRAQLAQCRERVSRDAEATGTGRKARTVG